MKKLLPLLILFGSYGCDPKPAIDKEALSQELERIYQDDQKYRAELAAGQDAHAWSSGEMEALRAKQHALDSANLKRIIQIIEQVGGYPGTSLVGHPTNEAAFYVLQHAPKEIQEKYYDIIIRAADKNELNKRLVAMY